MAGSLPSDEALDAFAAEARVEEAARARARRGSLADQAVEGATVRGLLVDLGERDAAVRLDLVGGATLVGRVVQVGADVARLEGDDGHEVLVALPAVAVVAPAVASDAVAGDRVVAAELTLADVLGWLVAERPQVQVHPVGADPVVGALVGVGADVLVVQVEGPQRRPAYVATEAVGHVVLVAG